MWMTKFEEHLAHSAPCSSMFDGFCRGDDVASLPDDDELMMFVEQFVGPLRDVPVRAMPDLSDLDELEIIF